MAKLPETSLEEVEALIRTEFRLEMAKDNAEELALEKFPK